MSDETSIYTAPAGPPEWIDQEEPDLRALTSTGELDRAMARLAALTTERAELEAQTTAAIQRVQMRAAALTSRVERGIAFWEGLIKGFANERRTQLLGTGKKKSRDLLHGRIGWRGGQERLVVKDTPEAKKDLEAWLERNPGFARVKVEPDMKAIQAAFKAEGLVPPGMDVEPEHETFHVEPVLPETALAKPETP